MTRERDRLVAVLAHCDERVLEAKLIQSDRSPLLANPSRTAFDIAFTAGALLICAAAKTANDVSATSSDFSTGIGALAAQGCARLRLSAKCRSDFERFSRWCEHDNYFAEFDATPPNSVDSVLAWTSAIRSAYIATFAKILQPGS